MFEHSYKMLYVLRPLVWGTVGYLCIIFGDRFRKKLLNTIAIFLLVMSVAAAALSTHMMGQVITYGYGAGDNEFTYMIVGTVMTVALLLCSILYFQFALSVGAKEDESSQKARKRERSKAFIKAILFPLCFMGFSIPLFLMEEVAGKVVGAVIEVLAIVAMIYNVREAMKEDKEKLD